MSKRKYYTADVKCGNCGYFTLILQPLKIKLGVLISEAECPRCGCQKLERK